MTDIIEEYEERRRLRRSRFRWRIVAVLAIIAAAIAWAMTMERPVVGPHLARFDVTGMILDDPERDELLKSIAEKSNAKALIVHINSPGGTVTGSEALYDALREIAAEKPVVATMGEVAASGGYIAALGADQVFARGNSITGSVGVIFQVPNAHALMEKVGVQMIEIKSGRLKAEPTPYKPVSADVIEAERKLVDDSFQWFLDLVRERRGLGDNAIAEIREGGVYTGRMAAELGLIDEIGNLDSARKWLESEHDIGAELEIVDYEVKEDTPGLPGLFGSLAPDWLSQTQPEFFQTGLLALYR